MTQETSSFLGLFLSGNGYAVHDSKPNLVSMFLGLRTGLVSHCQIVRDDEVSRLPFMLVLNGSIVLDDLVMNFLQNGFRFLSVRHPALWSSVVFGERIDHSEVEAEDFLARLRMGIYERMDRAPPTAIGDHPQLLPTSSFRRIELIDELGQRSKNCGTLGGTRDDVVESMGKWGFLKATINVPAGSANVGTPG